MERIGQIAAVLLVVVTLIGTTYLEAQAYLEEARQVRALGPTLDLSQPSQPAPGAALEHY